ncbi:MAG: DUF4062 domain-containing protein [Reinekea sp.]
MVVSLERHMEEERKILFEAVVGQHGIPVGLPIPAIPANYIYKLNSRCVAEADYVLLLVGTEYGALSDQGVSSLHSLYARAKALRKPIISLVYNGPAPKKQDEFDKKRLDGLVKQLTVGFCYYWKDSDSLRDATERALEHAFETQPAAGWVRAKEKTVIEFSDQNVVRQLKEQISQLTHKLRSSHSENVESKLEADKRPWQMFFQCNAFREGRLKQVEGQLDLTLKNTFDFLAPTLLAPVIETRIQVTLANKLHRQILNNVQSNWDGCHAVSDIKVHQNSIDELKLRFRALNLIDFDGQGRWQLTREGESMALKIHA